MGVHVFGIRHHGPGSARSLVAALEDLQPDIVLIEGPDEGEEILAYAADEAMKPPVAMLIYDPAEPKRCGFYPFALFSPEWQAIRHGLARGIPVRFMDLPQKHMLALRRELEKKPEKVAGESVGEADSEDEAVEATIENTEDPPGDSHQDAKRLQLDPLNWLARCAGYSSGERWWEHLIEERHERGGVFPAIAEAMTALRSELKGEEIPFDTGIEARREAWMRKTIRAAEKEGFEKIAVVCGAWHVPALADGASSAKDDARILKSLPKTRTAATWIPWTYWRMASASGYGAGIESPGWYDFLWSHHNLRISGVNAPEAVASRWITRAAQLLRDRDMDASTAGVIEAVRLSAHLAAIRARPLPDLDEMNEAIRAVFLMGEATALRLIHDELVIGNRLGEIPEGIPSVPIQQELQRLQKSLRLPPTADPKDYDFDLRKPNDLDRSRLLHRLAMLGVPWGLITEGEARSKGTFRESWRLEWKPEFVISLIEAATWGNTVESAAAGLTLHRAQSAESLAELTRLLKLALLADLGGIIPGLMQRLECEAAVSSDVPQMMEALGPLAEIMRYGDVRGTASGMVEHMMRGLVERVCIGLPAACSSLDDDAAEAMLARVLAADGALGLIENAGWTGDWRAALLKLADRNGVHGLVTGRCVRILFDTGMLAAPDAARRLSVALSQGNDPVAAGSWIEGFLRGSGMILLHSDELWRIMDAWVCSLREDSFDSVLPLVRRTFSTFPPPERRMMGERLKRAGVSASAHASGEAESGLAHDRAELVLPLVMRILGLGGTRE